MSNLLFILLIGFIPILRGFPYSTSCIPHNWNYPWTKVGNTWFTRSHNSGIWQYVADECSKIEPGRSSIASILTSDEQSNIEIDLPDEHWWIGGVQIGSNKW